MSTTRVNSSSVDSPRSTCCNPESHRPFIPERRAAPAMCSAVSPAAMRRSTSADTVRTSMIPKRPRYPDCAMTGYRGRFGIIEVLTVSAEVERRIAAGETAEHIAGAARRSGMKGLWDSGLQHVLRGESTLDELTRVVDIPEEGDRSPEAAAASRRSAGGGKARSGSPQGAAMAFTEPAPSAAPEELTTHFELLEEPEPPSVSGPHGLPARKVLLVDDEDSLRRVVKDLLERDGYIVSEARDGVQALDQVDRVGPDIIVLD